MRTALVGNRMVWASGTLLVGALQAWDSNALSARPFTQLLIAAGIALPPLAIGLTRDRGLQLIALIVAAILLTWARMTSPVALNTLHLALFVPALYVCFVARLGMDASRSWK